MTDNWDTLLDEESAKPYWAKLQQFLEVERSGEDAVYPPQEDVFRALGLTSLHHVRVVILGQDPYHGAGQADGLAFSVREGVPQPPSLQNIFKELESDLGFPPPNHGSLEHWARQGVLLLNTTLTVRESAAKSHFGNGWETFTDELLRVLGAKVDPTVFILWGNPSRKKRRFISEHHLTIESPHPSPLSVYRGFWGSKPFSKANDFLKAHGREPIDWKIPDL